MMYTQCVLQHMYFEDNDDNDHLTGQQDVEFVKIDHQCGGLEGGTRPGVGSVESTGKGSA